jgi:hypothetical protein
MPLYIAEHEHPSNACPAGNPQAAPGLLALMSNENARKANVKIIADAVGRGQHHLYTIVEAPDEKTVQSYFAPFQHFGSLKITPASHCEEVVARGAC